MKRILISALSFISLLNAADNKEISLHIHDKLYKGYHLAEAENHLFSFIGINKKGTLTSIVALRRSSLDFVEYTWSNKVSYHCYTEWFEKHSRLYIRPFSSAEPKDISIFRRAHKLSLLYLTTHGKHSESIS